MTYMRMEPGQHCWKVENIDSARVFIDAESYYANLYSNLQKARHSILMLGWDFHSKLALVRGQNESETQTPIQLASLLKHLGKQNENLDIRLLAWDFTTFYLPMREAFQKWKFRGLGCPNIKFVFDGQHPLGASHHQKLVVIDDQVAYCGGMDLTSKRWDTSRHLAKDPRRRSPDGECYPPFHDVQVGVTGPMARSLGSLARDRWKLATGEDLAPPASSSRKEATVFTFPSAEKNLKGAISRTMPAFQGRKEVREVEQLFLKQIGEARNYVYIENQYLTAPVIAKAIANRLAEEDGPEFLIVLPRDQSDPVSKVTMGVLTARFVKSLQAHDRHGHLFIGYPNDVDLPSNEYENVHAKVLVVDDEHVRIGSSNLNNRSLGLDTECDVTLLADGDAEKRAFFRRVAAQLLANHFDHDPAYVEARWKDAMGFRDLVMSLSEGQKRWLKEYDHVPEEPAFFNFADLDLVDADSATEVEQAGDRMLVTGFKDEVGLFFRQVPVGVILTVLACVVFGIYSDRFSWMSSLDQWMEAMGAFALVGLCLLPISVVAPLVVVMGRYDSILMLVSGVLVAALSGYGMGYAFRRWPHRLPGRWLPQVSEKMKDGNFWSIYWARFFPFAPFAIVSMICGRHQTPFAKYLIGTLLGSLPYVVGVYIFVNSLLLYAKDGKTLGLWLAVGSALFAALVLRALQKRFSVRMSHEHGK